MKPDRKDYIALTVVGIFIVTAYSLFLYINLAQAETPPPDNFNVVWTEGYSSLAHHEYYIDVQNLEDVNMDFDLSVLFSDTAFDLDDMKEVYLYEWKDIETEYPLYDTHMVERTCWEYGESGLRDVEYDCIVEESYQSGTVEYDIAQWKPTKMNMVKETVGGKQVAKSQSSLMNIPKYGSKAKTDEFGTIVTENGIKRFRLEFNTPSQSGGWWGTTGMVGIVNELTGILYHPWWDTGTYGYAYEIHSLANVSGMPISVNGTDGVGPSGTIFWTINETEDQQWLVSTGAAATGTLAVGNSTDELPWENETSMTGYLPTAVWDANYKTVYHLQNISANDSTSNENSIMQIDGDPQDAVGVFGGAVAYDGTDDAHQLQAIGADIDNDFTVEFWFYPTDDSTRQMVLCYEGDVKFFWQYDQNTDKKLDFTHVAEYIECTDTQALNEWHYVVTVVNNSGTNVYFYINNTLCGLDLTLSKDDKATRNFLGAYDTATFEFVGRIDEYRFSNIARNESYISANWQMGLNALMTMGAEETPPVISHDPPKWSNEIQQQANTSYATSRSFGFQIDWEERIDNVTFETNFTGVMANYTPSNDTATGPWFINFTQDNLTVGTHNYTWHAENVSGVNSTSTIAYILEYGNSTCDVAPATSEIVFRTASTPYCTVNNSQGECSLWANQSNITDQNDTSIQFDANVHTITGNYTATNYSACNISTELTVDKYSDTHWLWNTRKNLEGGPVTTNYTVTYFDDLNVTIVWQSFITDSANLKLIRNGTTIAESSQDDFCLLYGAECARNMTQLAAGRYNFTGWKDGTENYTENTTDRWHTVSVNTTTDITMWINDTENADYSATWPSDVNVTCYITLDIENEFTLVQNGTVVGTQAGQTMTYNSDMAAGIYNYTCNYTEQNFSADYEENTFTLGRATPDIDFTINGTEGNRTLLNGTFMNFTAVSDYTDTLYIDTGLTGWAIVSGAGIIENSTNTWNNTTAIPQEVNVTAYHDDENFTSNFVTWYLTIDDVEVISETYDDELLENSSNTMTVVFRVPTEANDMSVTLMWNGTAYENDTVVQNATHMTFTGTVITPPIIEDSSDATFYWNYSYADQPNRTTPIHTQTIYKPQLVQCNDTVDDIALFIENINETSPFETINASMDMLFTWGVNSSDYSANFSIINETFSVCIYPNWANFTMDGQIRYENATGPYDLRDWFFDDELLDNVTTSVSLMHIGDDGGDRIDLTVNDENIDPYPDVLIEIQRWYPELNEYRTVAIPKTDDQGKTQTYLTLYDVYYRFVMKKGGSTITTFSSRIITDTDLVFTIETGTLIDWIEQYDRITGSVTYDTTSGVVTAYYNDITGLGVLQDAALDVYQYGALIKSKVCSELNTTVPSGTMTCSVGNVTGLIYHWQIIGNLTTGDNDRFLIAEGYLNEGDITTRIFGNCGSAANLSACREGIIIVFFLTLLGTLVAIYSPVTSIVFMLISVSVSWVMGLFAISTTAFIGMIFVGAVIVYRLSKK